MISSVAIQIDAEAVVIRAEHPLRAVSSAIVGGGMTGTRAIVNLHVPKGFRCQASEAVLEAFARRRAIGSPFVGLLTGALTERAEVAEARGGDLTACAVVTVGLSNRSAAGRSAVAAWRPSTINTIVVVDADPEPGALVNLALTATEAKALALAEAGVRSADGTIVTGTSTDAVVIAATGRGASCRFGGPVSDLGWLVARTVKSAMDLGVARWVAEHR
jgi:iron complex transport system ATP-binding protein